MSNITQKGATGGLSLTSNGQFQTGTAVSTTPGAYGTSTSYDLFRLIGTKWDLDDGREVILVSIPTSGTIVAGSLYQDAAIVANHQGLSVTAFQAYSNNGDVPATVTVTLGATALTANQYQGGYVMVDSGTGIGQTLRISQNPAADASATGVVITLEDAPNTALDTTSTVCLIPAHGANVIINPTTPTGAPCGVGLYAVAANTSSVQYAYLVSKGLVAAKSDASAGSVGGAVSPSTTTAGDVTAFSTNTSVIGFYNQTGVSAKTRSVYLQL